MLRTTVYLDQETILALRQLANSQNRSQAEIIRYALTKYIDQVRPKERHPIAGIGGYRSGRKDISDKAEELLHRTGNGACSG